VGSAYLKRHISKIKEIKMSHKVKSVSKSKSKHVSKSKHSSKHKKITDPVLSIVCPRCGVFPGHRCINVSGEFITVNGERVEQVRGAKRHRPHSDRLRLSLVNLSEKDKAHMLEKVTSTFENTPEVKAKKAKEKLTPEQKEIVETLAEKIEVLGRHAEFVGPVSVGPIISTYRFFPVRKTKVAHLESMSKDFAVSLGAESIVVKRMPGESAVGVFVPNKNRKMVLFRDTLSNVADYMQIETRDKHKPIPLNFGIDSSGNPFVDDLTDQPHLLIAGTTGSGKSTVQHSIALGITWTMNPRELKLIISDTKGVEFKAFAGIPHLQFPICTNVYKTMEALNWCVKETQLRLDKIGQMDVRNIHEYNLLNKEHKLPYIVVMIDELADIIGPSLDRDEAKSNSSKLSVIVARSRASGIHVIAATQRPDVSLIKGSIKANFPTRLCFRLPSNADSRTILSTKGAENLMSRGDMFYQSSMSPELRRLHAPYTSLEDVKLVVEMIVKREQDERAELEKAANSPLSEEQVYKQKASVQ
jgi:S-DNA-T family DNA segregation ATPase FtsK/SpoIIIE